MEIKKKTWPNFFQKILEGKKTVDIRLADFDIKEGDTLILEEYNPKTKKYTGRTIKKKVKNLNKVRVTDYHPIEDINKYGHWVIELNN
jgi:ribosomal protein S17